MRPAPPCVRRDGSELVIRARLTPRSPVAAIGQVVDGALQVRVTAPPVDEAANEAARRLLARAFGVAPSRVRLHTGRRGRIKTFRVIRPRQIPGWAGSD